MANLFLESSFINMFSDTMYYPDDDIYVPLTRASVNTCLDLAAKATTPILDFVCCLDPSNDTFFNLWDFYFSSTFHTFITDYLLFHIYEQIPDAALRDTVDAIWDRMLEEGYTELAMDALYEKFDDPEFFQSFVNFACQNEESFLRPLDKFPNHS